MSLAAGKPLRVLCLDIEGGYGGSSRSLFEAVRHLPWQGIEIEVWCRKQGPIQDRYRELGVPVSVRPHMPTVSSLPRLSRNLYAYSVFLRSWLRSSQFRRDLLETVHRFNVVHLNHESLFILGRWLKRRSGRPVTVHVRTNLLDTPFARWQDRMIASYANGVVFITENERTTFESLAGRPVDGTVIYNPVPVPVQPAPRHPLMPDDGRFRIACLSSKYSYQRGTDRMIDLAVAVAERGRRDIELVIAGDMGLQRSLPGVLGRIARDGGTMADYAEHCGVADMVRFLGFVPNPEQVVSAANLVFKPTREWNGRHVGHPWGRDILEAMAAGRPVLSIGNYDRFVESGVTGVLQPDFDAGRLAEQVIRLADDPELVARLGRAARARVVELCDATARAADLLDVWMRAATGKPLQFTDKELGSRTARTATG